MGSDWERDGPPYTEDLDGSDKVDQLDGLDASPVKPRGFADDDIELNAFKN
jgi:hypothetical protein